MSANIIRFTPNTTPKNPEKIISQEFSRLDEVNTASPAKRKEITEHHLARMLDEVCARQHDDFDRWQEFPVCKKFEMPMGRTVREWLKNGYQWRDYEARMLPAIRGMILMDIEDAPDIDKEYVRLINKARKLANEAYKMPYKGQNKHTRIECDLEFLHQSRELLYDMTRLTFEAYKKVTPDIQLTSRSRAVLALALND